MRKGAKGTVRFEVGRRTLAALGAVALASSLSARLAGETISMTTWYPSPAGVYQRLVTTARTILARDGESVGIGTSSPQAKLDVQSTTSGFLPPRMTTAQRDAIAAPSRGTLIYNLDSNVINVYNGTAWTGVGGGRLVPSEYPLGPVYRNGAGRVVDLGRHDFCALSMVDFYTNGETRSRAKVYRAATGHWRAELSNTGNRMSLGPLTGSELRAVCVDSAP